MCWNCGNQFYHEKNIKSRAKIFAHLLNTVKLSTNRCARIIFWGMRTCNYDAHMTCSYYNLIKHISAWSFKLETEVRRALYLYGIDEVISTEITSDKPLPSTSITSVDKSLQWFVKFITNFELYSVITFIKNSGVYFVMALSCLDRKHWDISLRIWKQELVIRR